MQQKKSKTQWVVIGDACMVAKVVVEDNALPVALIAVQEVVMELVRELVKEVVKAIALVAQRVIIKLLR